MTFTETTAPAPADVFAAGLLDTPPNPNLIPEDRILNSDHGPHLDIIDEIEEDARERAEWDADRHHREACPFC